MILRGDARSLIGTIEDVQSLITSPPYWLHRDYGSSLGHERYPESYVENLADILDQAKLRLDGTMWVNIGDTYVDKCLQMIPAQFALAMIRRGWILREEIVWHKTNCRPESASDRHTRDFEMVYMFTRSKRYFFNVIHEPAKWEFWGKQTSSRVDKPQTGSSWQEKRPNRRAELAASGLRHPRSVWSIPSENRHRGLAPMPLPLARKIVECSTDRGDLVLDPFCGSGTTLLAAEMSGRRWAGIDLDETAVEMAYRRIRDHAPV